MARGLAFEARGSQRQEAGQEVLEPRTGVWGGGVLVLDLTASPPLPFLPRVFQASPFPGWRRWVKTAG